MPRITSGAARSGTVCDTAPVDAEGTHAATDVIDLFARSGSTIRFDDGTVTPSSELAVEARRLATVLAADHRPGDRIAIRMPNGRDYVRLLLACAAGGFVAVSVNTRYSDAEADELVGRSGARHVDPAVVGSGWSDADPHPVVARRDDPFVVFTTSGTTSRPKMVLHRQASIADHAVDVARGFGYRTDDTALVAMPLCGTFGLASLLGPVAAGSSVVVTDFELDRTARLIPDRRVTCLNGSDDMFHRLLGVGADLSSIRLGGYARFNTSLDGIVERAEAAGATLAGLYGMSEVQALFALRDPRSDATERARSGGTLVSPLAAHRIVDGELQLRGPSAFAGYLAEGGDRIDTELTGAAHDGDWFRTGDLAVDAGPDDPPRSFEYVTRLGDVLRLGGFLVSPSEIEDALMEVTGVDAAQVVAVDLPSGARPVAFVIAPGGVDEEAAIEHCRHRLARFKVPVRVVPIAEFPTTPSANGTKIQRVRLRELAAAVLAGR